MKRVKFIRLFAVVLLASALTVYFEACKKELVTPINNSVTQDDIPGISQDAMNAVKKIKKFKSQLADRDNVVKSGVKMPIDSVVWNVEALFNASHTFPDRNYSETVRQELEFSVAVDDTDDVDFETVADLYDEVTDAVREAYANDGIDTDKSLMAVVFDKADKNGNMMSIKAVVVSGKADKDVNSTNGNHGPFGPDDCWYYGEYGGTCDDPSVFGDAAEIIEDSINYYYRGCTVPKYGFRSLNVNMTGININGNEFLDDNGAPLLYFFKENQNPDLYLSYTMLNHYYYNELEVLLHLIPTTSPYQELIPPYPAFLFVDIQGVFDYIGGMPCYHHQNYVTYCSSWEIPQTSLESPTDLLD